MSSAISPTSPEPMGVSTILWSHLQAVEGPCGLLYERPESPNRGIDAFVATWSEGRPRDEIGCV